MSSPSSKRILNVAIIGGGAAGFFGAIACAEKYPQTRVTIYEKGAHVLTKVRISGGGRCNVTHACFDPKLLVKNYPRGGQALLGPFHKFQPRDTVQWFESHGVALKTEDDNRIFPTTDMSLTIINALKEAAEKARVTVRTFSGPSTIEPDPRGGFMLGFVSGERNHADRVLLATGSNSQAWGWAKQFGHTIEPPVPSLFTFTIPDERLAGLAGLSVERATIKIVGTDLEQTGPLLITHWGLSGPAVLKLSAWGARVLCESNYESPVQVNWVGAQKEKAREQLTQFKKNNPKKSLGSQSPFKIPQRLWERLVATTPIQPTYKWADISNDQLKRLEEKLVASVFHLRGINTFKEEFVTAGGVHLDEVNFQTMESRKIPGLFFAGEILDIDGVTGGFNFQNAWTTSWLAGQAIGK
jgi:predicted Rossmann fold flavoprotein